MFPSGNTYNTNTFVDSVYREARETTFIKNLEFRTASGRIAKIHRNEFTALITQPLIDEDQIVATMTDANQCELPINSVAVVTDESVKMDKTLYGTFELCETEQAYITVDVKAKMDYVIDLKIMYAIDKYVIDTAIALAGNAIPAVVDKATAEAAIDAVDVLFTGYTNLEGDIKVIVPASMKPFFKHLMSDRITVAGDNVFMSGNLSMISGMEFIFIADGQLTDPTKVLFVTGQPVHLWIDEAGFMNGSRSATPTNPNVVSFNMVHFSKLNLKAHVWSQKTNRIVVAG